MAPKRNELHGVMSQKIELFSLFKYLAHVELINLLFIPRLADYCD
jgi:hypothetical protein